MAKNRSSRAAGSDGIRNSQAGKQTRSRVALLGTKETKARELDLFERLLAERGLDVERVDLSLAAKRRLSAGDGKLRQMEAAASKAADVLRAMAPEAVAAIGGGTGSEMALRAMRDLPLSVPRFLVTTLSFDPRPALADSPVTLVPTLCDIQGVNASLRQTFTRAAAMVAAAVRTGSAFVPAQPCIAVTMLGVTQQAGSEILRLLSSAGCETMAFHAAGFGGAALARFARQNQLAGVVDMTVHEIVRTTVHGDHAPMPDRFTSAGGLPRVVLPGGMNFLDAGPASRLTKAWRSRPRYQHHSSATHVQLSLPEISRAAKALASSLNASTAHCEVLLPMGGFSSEDRPGGLIEAPHLRERAARILESEARAYAATRLPSHINDPATASEAVARLLPHLTTETDSA